MPKVDAVSDELRRSSLLSQLQYIDPNGAWTDAHLLSEGEDPLTLEEAEAAYRDMVARA